jgi:hypothetical protein
MHVTPYLIIDSAVQSAKVRDPFGHIWLITRSGGASA